MFNHLPVFDEKMKRQMPTFNDLTGKKCLTRVEPRFFSFYITEATRESEGCAGEPRPQHEAGEDVARPGAADGV